MLEIRVAVVPGDELRRRPRAGEVFARNVQATVALRTGRVDDRVVEPGEIRMREVASHLDVAEEPEARPGRDPLERPGDRLQLRVVGRDAEPHQTPGRGQALDHVHLDRQVRVE